MTPARMGRPPALTRAQIARVVIEVGFENLTMAAVRDRLGVGHTTLYRYAADRDELVRMGISRLLEYAPWPSRDGHWRHVMTQYALTLWQLWADNPGAASEATRGILPLNRMRLTDDLCAILLRQGFTPINAVLACDVVFDMVTDTRSDIERFDWANPDAGSEHLTDYPDDYPNQAPSQNARPATQQELRLVQAAMAAALDTAPPDWFARKLHVVLDGVEHALAP